MKELITPEMATEMLKRNINNRPISKTHVKRLVNAIQTGEWKWNGETIKISIDNILLDGQHRLKAIIESDTPLELEVIRGLSHGCTSTIDQGNKRSLADLIAMDGRKGFTESASLTRHIFFFRSYNYDAKKVMHSLHTAQMLFEFYKENETDIENSLFATKHLKKQGIIVDYSKVSFMYNLCSKIDSEMASIYLQKLIEGIFIEPNCAIGSLRHFLITQKYYHKYKNTNLIILDMLFRSWNMWRMKTPCNLYGFKVNLEVKALPELI